MKTVILLVLLMGLFNFANAQKRLCECTSGLENGWCWGDDLKIAKEKNVLYTDALNSQDYKGALEPIEWLLQNTPCLKKSIYINSVKIYQKLVKKEKDPTLKIKYQDRMLELFDLRIQYFGQEASVLQRKGNRAYSYLYKREGVDKKALYDLYKKIYELNGTKTNRSNIKTYMLLAVNAKRKKTIEVSQLLEIYEQLSNTIETIIKEGKEVPKWVKTQDAVDGLLDKGVKIDCEFVKKNMGEDLKSNPDNLKLAKRALKYIMRGKCTDDPLFLIAAENIYKQESSIGLAVTIAKKYLSDKIYDKTLEWYAKGIELSSEYPKKQGELYLDVAKVYNIQGKKRESRSHAKKALEADISTKSEVYTMIGNLYMNSGSSCQGKDIVQNRYCYLAAYDAYQKAGNTSKMTKAKEQFPSITDMFTLGYEEGASIDIGCWIGGRSSLRRRPKSNQ